MLGETLQLGNEEISLVEVFYEKGVLKNLAKINR